MHSKIVSGCPWTAWRVGRVLSDEDVTLLASYYEEFAEEVRREINRRGRARQALLMELGGEELLEAVESEDEAQANALVQKIIGELNEKRVARVREQVLQRKAAKSYGR